MFKLHCVQCGREIEYIFYTELVNQKGNFTGGPIGICRHPDCPNYGLLQAEIGGKENGHQTEYNK